MWTWGLGSRGLALVESANTSLRSVVNTNLTGSHRSSLLCTIRDVSWFVAHMVLVIAKTRMQVLTTACLCMPPTHTMPSTANHASTLYFRSHLHAAPGAFCRPFVVLRKAAGLLPIIARGPVGAPMCKICHRCMAAARQSPAIAKQQCHQVVPHMPFGHVDGTHAMQKRLCMQP